MSRPNTPHIRRLPSDLDDCKADLTEAATAEQAQCARESIHALSHSLWLAGYQPEETY